MEGVAPALQGAVGPHAARVAVAGADRAEGSLGGVRLSEGIVTPAGDGAVGAQSAGVVAACVHRSEVRCLRRVLFRRVLLRRVLLRQGHQPESAAEEGGHLGPVDVAVGAVAQGLAATADRDPRRGQSVDSGGVSSVGVNVDEARRIGLFKIERPREERRHLGADDVSFGTEPGRFDAAPIRHPQLEEPIDERRPPQLSIHIHKARDAGCFGVCAVEDPDQPHRHLPALQRLLGTDQSLSALHADQHALTGQRLEAQLMNTAVIITEVAPVTCLILRDGGIRPDPQHRPHHRNSHRGPNQHAAGAGPSAPATSGCRRAAIAV